MATGRRPTIRIRSADEDIDPPANAEDLIDRLTPSLLITARLVSFFPEHRRSPPGVRDRNLAMALMVGVRTCQTRVVGENLDASHKRLQNLHRKSPSLETAQERHETTSSHALGQLQALLALGYCASLGERKISKRLLRPLAPRLIERVYGEAEFAKLDPGPEAQFDLWVDKIRQRVRRMPRKLTVEGRENINTLAERAIQKVDVLLRNARKRPVNR